MLVQTQFMVLKPKISSERKMGLVYDGKSEPFTGSMSNLARANATKHASTHFDNSLYLNFMLQNGSITEKHLASKELMIAERKINFWKRHPNFNKEEYLKNCEAAKKKWVVTR